MRDEQHEIMIEALTSISESCGPPEIITKYAVIVAKNALEDVAAVKLRHEKLQLLPLLYKPFGD